MKGYIINIEELEKTVQDAVNAGYNATVIINGEYYDIKAPKGDKPKNFIDML